LPRLPLGLREVGIGVIVLEMTPVPVEPRIGVDVNDPLVGNVDVNDPFVGNVEMRFARHIPPSALTGPISSPPKQDASTHVPA
jgi:hypothetical protein